MMTYPILFLSLTVWPSIQYLKSSTISQPMVHAPMSVLEIAKRAGVSPATVSRVLNNHPSVRPETLQQVRKVLADLNYARPAIRRGPRLGRRAGLRTGNVAVLGIGDTDHTRFQVPIFAAALTGIVQAARDMD